MLEVLHSPTHPPQRKGRMTLNSSHTPLLILEVLYNPTHPPRDREERHWTLTAVTLPSWCWRSCIIPPTHLKKGKGEAENHLHFGYLDAWSFAKSHPPTSRKGRKRLKSIHTSAILMLEVLGNASETLIKLKHKKRIQFYAVLHILIYLIIKQFFCSTSCISC